jgi:hypothetical protein
MVVVMTTVGGGVVVFGGWLPRMGAVVVDFGGLDDRAGMLAQPASALASATTTTSLRTIDHLRPGRSGLDRHRGT